MGYIFLIYFLGFPGYIWTRRYRAGIGIIQNLSPKTFFYNVQWTMETAFGALLWPLMLILWFTQGKPQTKWKVVGEKNGSPLIRKISDKGEYGSA